MSWRPGTAGMEIAKAMVEWLVAFLLIVCGGLAIFLAVRYNRYLSSYDEPGSVMYYFFGRTGFRIFWVIFGLALALAGILVLVGGGIHNI